MDSLWFWTKIFNERLLEKLWKSRDPLEETIAWIPADFGRGGASISRNFWKPFDPEFASKVLGTIRPWVHREREPFDPEFTWKSLEIKILWICQVIWRDFHGRSWLKSSRRNSTNDGVLSFHLTKDVGLERLDAKVRSCWLVLRTSVPKNGADAPSEDVGPDPKLLKKKNHYT